MTLVQEEGHEVGQILCKIDHHGLDSEDPRNGHTNRHLLWEECCDQLAVLRLLQLELGWSDEDMLTGMGFKYQKLRKWHPILKDSVDIAEQTPYFGHKPTE